jgi:fibronectin-binding autotransporter adhesin
MLVSWAAAEAPIPRAVLATATNSQEAFMTRVLCKATCARLPALAFLIFATASGTRAATTYNWFGPSGPAAPWSVPVLWSPAGMPGTGDTANIATLPLGDRSVLYDYVGPAVTLASLTVNDAPSFTVPSLLMSANNLSATTEYVGNSTAFPGALGGGWFQQLGGVNTVGAGGLYLGFTGADFGGYDLGGTASVAGNVTIANSSGTGYGLLQVYNSGALAVSGTIVAYQGGSVAFSGGTINAAALNFNGVPSRLNWTGGTLNITSATAFDSAAAGTSTSAAFGSSRTLGSGQTLKISGNETLGGTGSFALSVNSGGLNNVVGDLYVNALGSLTINTGGTATENALLIGNNSVTSAHVIASGTNAKIQAATSIHVGNSGLGDMTVSGGASVSAANAFQVGPYVGSTGTLHVSGTNSVVQGAWYVWAGWNGQGTITVDTGGTVTSPGDLSLAVQPNSQGTVNINGGGTITVASAYVGGNWANAVGGLGVLNVNKDVNGVGTLNVSGALEIVSSASANRLNLAGGTINTGGLNLHGTPSLLNWTSGTLNINSSVTFDSAAAATSTGAALGSAKGLTSGQTLKLTGDETLGGTGAFALTLDGGTNTVTGILYVNTLGNLTVNTGTVSTSSVRIGPNAGSNSSITVNGGTLSAAGNQIVVGYDGTGTLNQSSGAVSITGGQRLVIGNNPGSIGFYNLSGGSFMNSGSSEWVGSSGTGTLTQTGGTNTMDGVYGLNVGAFSGASGTFTISAGTTSIFSNATIGGSATNGVGGTGVLNVSGTGGVTIGGTLIVYNTPGSKVNLTGGTMNTSALNFNGTPALLNWIGGTLNITSDVTFDSAAASTSTSAAFGPSLALGSGQTLKITGSETLGGSGAFALTVNSGSTHLVTGDLVVNHTGSLTINSGGSATTQNTLWVGEHAALTTMVAVSGSGATMQSAELVIGTTGRGNLSVDAGAVVTSSGPMVLGDSATGIGTATISGTSSKIQPSQFQIGRIGQGTLTVNSGGRAEPTGGTAPSFFLGLENGGQGTLVVNSGGRAYTPSNVHVGYGAGGTGQVTVAGALQADVAVRVGRLGTGTMDISASGVVTTPLFLIGSQGGGTGTVNVNGGTIMSPQVDVAAATPSSGTMAITAGGAVSTQVFAVGVLSGGVGQATLDGIGSHVTAQGASGNILLVVGQHGQGTLTMTNSASATAPVTEIGEYSDATGQVTISGGAGLQTSQYLSVGTSYNPYSDPPVFVGPAGGQGTLTLNGGGSASAGIQVLTGNNGTVDVTGGGSLAVGNIGAMTPAAGSALVGTGGIVGGTGTIKGTLVNDGGSVQPGFSPGILHVVGDYSQHVGGTLNIEIGGPAGTQYDKLAVTGNLEAGGTLAVSLINGYLPLPAATFGILGGSISGAFSTLNLPTLGGRIVWDSSQLYTSGNLTVSATYYAGDINRDSLVDVADVSAMMTALCDLSKYQTTTGLDNSHLPLVANLTDDNLVNNADLQGLIVVLANGSGGGSLTAVPEPITFILLAPALAAMVCVARTGPRRDFRKAHALNGARTLD